MFLKRLLLGICILWLIPSGRVFAEPIGYIIAHPVDGQLNTASKSSSAENDILDFLPAILSNVEKAPPRPTRWRVKNELVCPSGKSDWLVTSRTTQESRGSSISRRFADPVSSSFAEIEAGEQNFTWALNTSRFFSTCGNFGGQFWVDMKPGRDYEFLMTLVFGAPDVRITELPR